MLSTGLAHVEHELLLPQTLKETIMATVWIPGNVARAVGDPVGCGLRSNS
jgi:hypothetical protein